MRFERGKDIKEAIEIGKYSDMIPVWKIVQEIRGGQTVHVELPNIIGELFLEELSTGVRIVPSGIRLPNGTFREEYRLIVEQKDGSWGNYTALMNGKVLKFMPTGEIYSIPEDLTTKIHQYEF